MMELASGWSLETERGPDWLFIKLTGPDNGVADGLDLAERVWELLQQHLTSRVVLEMDHVRILRSVLIGQLVMLHRRVASHGGIMRLSGLSDDNQMVLRACRMDDRFPQFGNRSEAVLGRLAPNKPR